MQRDRQERATVDPQNMQEQAVTGTQKGADAESLNSDEAQAVAQLTRQLETEQTKSEEYLDMLKRTQADFINYKRRVGQEQNEGRAAAQSAILEQILPVLDDLGRALQAAPPELANNSWVHGILLVAKRVMTTLEQLGVQQIGKPGEQFDPRRYEAVGRDLRSDVPEGTVVQVVRPGYILGERIIRPAQVVVASSV